MLKRIVTRIARLSENERASLGKLCSDNTCDIPHRHALRLLELGLVELYCGALDPTGPTRIAMRKVAAS